MAERRSVTRVQTGVRMERRILLVLKALAGALDLTVGDLLEGVVLHAFEGKAPEHVDQLKAGTNHTLAGGRRSRR